MRARLQSEGSVLLLEPADAHHAKQEGKNRSSLTHIWSDRQGKCPPPPVTAASRPSCLGRAQEIRSSVKDSGHTCAVLDREKGKRRKRRERVSNGILIDRLVALAGSGGAAASEEGRKQTRLHGRKGGAPVVSIQIRLRITGSLLHTPAQQTEAHHKRSSSVSARGDGLCRKLRD